MNLSRTKNDAADENIFIDLNQKIDDAALQALNRHIQDGSQISLIHNAFPYYKDSSESFNGDDFDLAAQFVLKNTIILNNFVLPKMGTGSSIVFVGSTLSTKAAPNCLTYVILKHAQVGLMKSLALELGSKEIHTCCVCPGFTDTEMLKSHTNPVDTERLISSLVLKKRLISPDEVAAFIYQCATSPISNSEVFHVNLGQV